LPSLAFGHWLATHRPPEPASSSVSVRVVACADSVDVMGAVGSALPFADAERRSLAEAVAPAMLELHVDRDADSAALAVTATAGTGFLQFVGHGCRDENRVDAQGLVLGDGSRVFPRDLEALRLPAHVCFAACGAGRGRLRRGDEGRHVLAGAALLAGARAVIAPWTDVDYRASLALVGALHRRLWREGADLGEALRAARVECATSAPGSLDPLLFHLVGLGDAAPGAKLVRSCPDEPAPSGWRLVSASVVTAIALFAWGYARRSRVRAE
jgi:CHAT domain-containing protein